MSTQPDQQADGAEDVQGGDMLSTLKGISTILKGGFEGMENQMSSLKKSMKTSNTNMVALNTNINSAFKELKEQLVQSESEDDSSIASVGADSGQGSRPGRSSQSQAGDSHSAAARPIPGGSHDMSSSDEDDSVLASKTKEIVVDSTVGPPLQDEVAEFLSKSFAKKWKHAELDKKRTAYPRPTNADCLTTPRINESVFVKLGTQPKNRDRGWQNNHTFFAAAVTAMSRVADLLMINEKSAPWVKEALSLSADALSLCGALNAEWTKSRREDIKTYLPEDFKRLVSDEAPASKTWLFGDDLEGSIKAVEIHNRLAKKMENPSPKEKKGNQQGFNNKKKWGKRKRKDFKSRSNDDDYEKDKKRQNSSGKDFRKRGNNR